MFVYSFLASISFLISCQTEPASAQDSLETIVEELVLKAEKEQSAVNATIKKTGDYYSLELVENIEPLALGLYLGMETNFSDKNNQLTDVVITCVESGEFTVCSGNGGMGQMRCVGKAIKACFDKGECAEVCNQEILIIPPGLK